MCVLQPPELPWPVPFLLLFPQVLAACPACVGRLCPASLNSPPVVTYLFESIPLQRAPSSTYTNLLLWRVADKLQ